MGFKRKPAKIDLGQPEWTFSDDELDQSLFLRGNLQLSYLILNAKRFLHERTLLLIFFSIGSTPFLLFGTPHTSPVLCRLKPNFC